MLLKHTGPGDQSQLVPSTDATKGSYSSLRLSYLRSKTVQKQYANKEQRRM